MTERDLSDVAAPESKALFSEHGVVKLEKIQSLRVGLAERIGALTSMIPW